jgi:predicted enzyme related to lactoylglutathione lyase
MSDEKTAGTNAAASARGRVLGVGGLFFASADTAATAAWYQRALGMQPNDFGGFDFLHEKSVDRFPVAARTIFAPFSADSDYFAPSRLPFMFNLIVDNLQAVLAHAAAEGVEPVQPSEHTDYGDFAWLMDPDGRKVELWQPREPC